MTHQDREQLDGWLRERGATVDTPADLRRKVAVPRADPDPDPSCLRACGARRTLG